MKFKEWMRNQEAMLPEAEEIHTTPQQGVVSFDFDGVLHTDVIPGTHHPLSHWDTDLTPNETMHHQLRQEAAKNKIVVVSARCPNSKSIIANFCEQYGLPITGIYATCDQPKLPILLKLHAIRHYDDNLKVGRELANSDIEFIYVKVPVNEKMKKHL